MNRRNFLSGCIAAAVASTVKLPEVLPDDWEVDGVRYTTRYVHRTYGLAYHIKEENPEEWIEGYPTEEIGARFARALAQSMLQTKVAIAANILEGRMFYGDYDALPRQPAEPLVPDGPFTLRALSTACAPSLDS